MPSLSRILRAPIVFRIMRWNWSEWGVGRIPPVSGHVGIYANAGHYSAYLYLKAGR